VPTVEHHLPQIPSAKVEREHRRRQQGQGIRRKKKEDDFDSLQAKAFKKLAKCMGAAGDPLLSCELLSNLLAEDAVGEQDKAKVLRLLNVLLSDRMTEDEAENLARSSLVKRIMILVEAPSTPHLVHVEASKFMIALLEQDVARHHTQEAILRHLIGNGKKKLLFLNSRATLADFSQELRVWGELPWSDRRCSQIKNSFRFQDMEILLSLLRLLCED